MILAWLMSLIGRDGSPSRPKPAKRPKAKPASPAKPKAATAPPPSAIRHPSSAATPPPLDPRTAANIATLHPRAQAAAREFMVLAADIATRHGLVVKIISGLRSYAEQDALYAKGRTAPGPRVTNARAGYSNHNFGTAWDIGLFQGKDYITRHPAYREIGQAGKSLGLTWGGDFKSIVDEPHFEIPTGLTLAQMRQRVRSGQDLFA